MNERKYYYSKNAATYREAVGKFAAISFVASTPISVGTILLAISQRGCHDSATTITMGLLIPAIHVLSWMVVFIMMCAVYAALNNADRHPPTPPTPPTQKTRKLVEYEPGKWRQEGYKVDKRT